MSQKSLTEHTEKDKSGVDKQHHHFNDRDSTTMTPNYQIEYDENTDQINNGVTIST